MLCGHSPFFILQSFGSRIVGVCLCSGVVGGRYEATKVVVLGWGDICPPSALGGKQWVFSLFFFPRVCVFFLRIFLFGFLHFLFSLHFSPLLFFFECPILLLFPRLLAPQRGTFSKRSSDCCPSSVEHGSPNHRLQGCTEITTTLWVMGGGGGPIRPPRISADFQEFSLHACCGGWRSMATTGRPWKRAYDRGVTGP